MVQYRNLNKVKIKRFRFNLKNVATIVACFVVSMVFAACDKTSLSDKQITAFGFSLPPAAGVINEIEKTITVDLPLGTDISSLAPIINVSQKATVSPASEVPQNFTEPMIYTVTAEDGSTAKYTVIINTKETEQEENTIVGKWKLIAQGYYDKDNNNTIVINPIENSSRYIEFLSNGKMKRPFFSNGEIIEIEYPYQIDEQFLYENYMDEENAFIYKYKLDNNKLTLDYVQGNIEDIYPQIVIHIYQR